MSNVTFEPPEQCTDDWLPPAFRRLEEQIALAAREYDGRRHYYLRQLYDRELDRWRRTQQDSRRFLVPYWVDGRGSI